MNRIHRVQILPKASAAAEITSKNMRFVIIYVNDRNCQIGNWEAGKDFSLEKETK